MEKQRRRDLKHQGANKVERQSDALNKGSLPRLGVILLRESRQNAHSLSDPDYLALVLEQISGAMFPLEESTCEIDVHAADSEGTTVLHYACTWGDTRAVRLLLAAGVDVNALGDMGQQPLHVAVSSRFCDIVELLLSHNASTNQKDLFGYTPLEWANQMGYQDVCSLLEKR